MFETLLTNIASSAIFSWLKKLPRTTRWLLLIAALLIVIIFLTLLLTGKFHKKNTIKIDDTPIEMNLFQVLGKDKENKIDLPFELNWSDVIVGEGRKIEIKIVPTVSSNVIVAASGTVPGFEMLQTCNEMKRIDTVLPCRVDLKYKPTDASAVQELTMSVSFWGDRETKDMARTQEIKIKLGAKLPAVDKQPAKTEKMKPVEKQEQPIAVVDDEPDNTDDIFDDSNEILLIADEVEQSVKRAVTDIAPSDPFSDAKPVTVSKKEKKEFHLPPESCSDFAFPGYDAYGAQIGWIKPDRGSYYFHPFSDRDCKNATGVYNPNNGIITDINNSGKRIGTDAEHIGYIGMSGEIPKLSNSVRDRKKIDATAADADWDAGGGTGMAIIRNGETVAVSNLNITKKESPDVIVGTSGDAVLSTEPYDRTFVLRQYKPIPATIVSDVRTDPQIYNSSTPYQLPVRATVDRNVYSDNGRTVVIPAGTLLLGYITGDLPGPYKSIGRMDIRWYQFILPSGAEFNFKGDDSDPFSGDAQGRVGVPGHGSTDYIEQIVMPMLTAIVPAAVNMIAPIADTFVNKIDLDSNTVTQSGTLRSSELAKNQVVNAWNQVAQKLLIDAMDNTVPPFTIAAGTRITVYSPTDLIITCGEKINDNCSVSKFKIKDKKTASPNYERANPKHSATPKYDDGSWVGQVRSFNKDNYCIKDSDGLWTAKKPAQEDEYDYTTMLMYCQSLNYEAKNNVKYEEYKNNGQHGYVDSQTGETLTKGTKSYNEQVLGLKYDDNDKVVNPFEKEKTPAPAEPSITCLDGSAPDSYGCCTGEIYTDMGEQGFNCCPESGGDCFPPITQ